MRGLFCWFGHVQVVMLNELSKFREAKQSLSSSVTDIASQHLQRSILKMRMSMLVKVLS